jgi:hypothetical protein
MKKNIILLLIAGLGILPGCKKALTETPKGSIAPDQFFTTATQCTEAVNGVYYWLNDLFGQESLWQVTESCQDLTVVEQLPNVNFQFAYSRGNSANSDGMWSKCYNIIKDANLTINRVGGADIDPILRARLVGETKFIRAMNYYILSNIFGGVPLWTDELDVDAVSKLPRASLQDVQKQMVADLTDATAALPLSYDAADVGRVTKGAAQTLLAKVYLAEKDWADAATAALAVENSKTYTLMTNYANLFDINDGFKNNSESVFEIQFKYTTSSAIDNKTTYYCTWYFPFQDAGKPTYAGVNFGTTVLRGFEVYYPSAKFVNLFEANDIRMPVALGYGYNGITYTRLPKPGRPWFGPKFWDLKSNVQASGKDVYFLRYADVIMTLAEAYNEQGNTAGSITEIDKIRSRAGVAALDPGLSQDSVRQAIMNERAKEFVGEFQRRWDLQRWGQLVPAIQAMGADNPSGIANIKSYQNYFPIPVTEIVKNPNLTQNEGY